VILAGGEAPEGAWLCSFRAALPKTKVSVFVEPAFGYRSELTLPPKELARRVQDGVLNLLRQAGADHPLFWAHNLGLGRNFRLTRELLYTARCCGLRLVAHHHDWWFDNRWQHFAGLQEPGLQKLDALAQALFQTGYGIRHVAINQADAAVLAKHLPGAAGWLPNPVACVAPARERVECARAWLCAQLGEAAPVWLLPCRLLRRKNVAEAILLTRWLRPEAWLVSTGGPSSAEEQAYADRLSAAIQQHGWRVRLGNSPRRRGRETHGAGTMRRQRGRVAHLVAGRLRPALSRSGGGGASVAGPAPAQPCAGPGRVWLQVSPNLSRSARRSDAV
jgi:hypothetical protein